MAFSLAVGSGLVYVGGSVDLPASFGSLTLPYQPGGRSGFLACLPEAAPLAGQPPTSAPAGVSLFPNPSSGRSTLRLPVAPNATTATIRWYSATGQLVRTQSVPLGLPDTTLELLLDGLPAGPYYLRIEAGDQRSTRTLVVE